MRSIVLPTVLAVGLLTLTACGQSPGCRAMTGGAIGAAGGAAIGALAGNPLMGAAAGAIAGVATGALTLPNQVSVGPSPVCN